MFYTPSGDGGLKSSPVASHGESFIPPSAADYFMRFFMRLKMASANACINHTTIKNVIPLFFKYLIFTVSFFCFTCIRHQQVYYNQQKFKHV
jgi:hypothetical protein